MKNLKTLATPVLIALLTAGCPENGQNMSPMANAGEDQTLPLTLGQNQTIVQLNGAGSIDPDGNIQSYEWTGSVNPDDVANPVVTLGMGQFSFSLMVTDNNGATSVADTVNVIVLDALMELDAPNFDDLSFFQLNGAATTVSNGTADVLRLTTNFQQAGSAFAIVPLPMLDDGDIPSFSTMFTFSAAALAGNLGAGDGLTFALTPSPNSLGAIGGSLGIQGIDPSFAVEFDMFQNNHDDSTNHIAFVRNGDVENATVITQVPFDMAAATEVYVWIDFFTANFLAQMQVRISDTPTRPADALATDFSNGTLGLGSVPVYAGFTAATGGAGSTHDINDWIFEIVQ